jgi:hypothetical protein
VPISGRLRLLFLYDVAESIRLDTLRLPESKLAGRSASSGARTEEFARFERPPVIENFEAGLVAGEQIFVRRKYYDVGIITIELSMPFADDWPSLVLKVSRLVNSTEFENYAAQALYAAKSIAGPSLVKPYDTWLSDDYYIVQLDHVFPPGLSASSALPAQDLLVAHGPEIAQLVRGDDLPLSDAERQEVLQASISYSSTDLLVVGWKGALVYDKPEDAEATLQLLEFANTQLLEFRHYDNLLTRLLEQVYTSLEHRKGIFAAWHLSREASRLNTLRLDVMELTEKSDNAIKFVSDMFFARLYRLAAARVGVPDYRNLVEQKLGTAGELYKFMVDRFDQSRGFILELTIVVILVIDLWLLLRGY